MTTMKSLPDIYQYMDFRAYLRDYRRMRLSFDPGFTHTYICYRLGQKNSRSYFANVVNGIKPVTQEFINRLIELLELDEGQAKYFRALVNYGQTYNPGEKEYYLEQLIRQNITRNRLITEEEYAFYREWHHSVIRAMLDVFDFRGDCGALARMIVPPVAVGKVRRSIRLLESLNLIAKDKRGYYRPTDTSVGTKEYVRDDLIMQYQLRCLEMAKSSIVARPAQPQDISTNILSVSEEGFRKVQKRLRKFREELRALVHNDGAPADRVYQLDIQLFPNSRVNEKRTVRKV